MQRKSFEYKRKKIFHGDPKVSLYDIKKEKIHYSYHSKTSHQLVPTGEKDTRTPRPTKPRKYAVLFPNCLPAAETFPSIHMLIPCSLQGSAWPCQQCSLLSSRPSDLVLGSVGTVTSRGGREEVKLQYTVRRAGLRELNP